MSERPSPLKKPAHWNFTPLDHVRHVVAIASGKGGVGKSTTTVNLALSMAQAGHTVGILDADIHGPSIPKMLGLEDAGQPPHEEEHILPHEAHGIRTMSMGFFAGDNATIWRGPMITKALTQMLRNVCWGTWESPLDILLVDMPPGTGDVHISMVQQVPLQGAIIVTTPQEVATIDAAKCLSMFRQVRIPILGVVENMSYFVDDQGHKHHLFGAGGGRHLAGTEEVPFLGEVALDKQIGHCGDRGDVYIHPEDDNLCTQQYRDIATNILEHDALFAGARSAE